MHYCNHALSVVFVCPSSVVDFSHFRLLLNCLTEFNETWKTARSQRPLPSWCFSDRLVKQDWRLGLWLAETFSTSPLKPLKGIQRHLTGSKILMSSTKFVFLGRSEKDGRPCLWLTETFSTFPLKHLDEIQRNLTGSKIFTSSTKLMIAGRWKNMMTALASDWLIEKFSTSLKPQNRIQRNLTRSKISISPTKFVFFGPIEKKKTRWLPWPLIGWYIFDFSSETAEWNSM